MDVAAWVDTVRHPMADLHSAAGRAFVAECRDRLLAAGAVSLPGFLTAAATIDMTEEARALESTAHEYQADHTVYFQPSDDKLPEGHALRRRVRTDKGNVPYDRIPRDSRLRALYNWDGLLNFVAAVLGEPVLYRHPDPMAALNINTHGPGQELGWHFDRTDFAVTLSLQQCEQGGVFEYIPNLRSMHNENFAGVARVLDGSTDGVRCLTAAPGTLTLFRGHYSLHRVTPGSGARKRLMAALSYVTDPDVVFSAYARKLFYGRDIPVSIETQ
jgi:alkylated DNA repair dioxygenase AlkB